MKYAIRSGKVRGRGEYIGRLTIVRGEAWVQTPDRDAASRFDMRGEALERVATLAEHGLTTRIVRLLSHEEAKRKAVRQAETPAFRDLERIVRIEVVAGVEGSSMYLNGYRIAGPKPWGGGKVTHRIDVDVGVIKTALEMP